MVLNATRLSWSRHEPWNEGATEIYAASSHGLFVKGAVELLDQAPTGKS